MFNQKFLSKEYHHFFQNKKNEEKSILRNGIKMGESEILSNNENLFNGTKCFISVNIQQFGFPRWDNP